MPISTAAFRVIFPVSWRAELLGPFPANGLPLGNTVSPSALVDTNAFDSAVTRQDPDPTPNDNHLQAPQRGQQLHSKRPGQG